MVPLTQVASSISTGKIASISCTTNTGATCSVRDFSSSDNIFGVAFRYTPQGGSQLEAQLSGTFTFDASTEVPTFNSPATGASIRDDFRLQFSLPESPSAGTVRLLVSRTGGAADGNGDRTIVFGSVTNDNYVFDLTSLNGAASIAGIESVSPDVALVDGAVYSFTLSYQDAAGNAAATVTHTGVAMDSSTQPIVLNSPAVDARVKEVRSLCFMVYIHASTVDDSCGSLAHLHSGSTTIRATDLYCDLHFG